MSNLTRDSFGNSSAVVKPQTPTPTAGTAGAAITGATITPNQIVSALIGADFVVLKGFNCVKTKPLPFWLPAISQFDVTMSAPAARKASLLTHRLSVLAVLIMFACVGLLTYWGQEMYGLALATSKVRSQAALWSVKSVSDDGVRVRMGNAFLTVPVGAMLPNGEILRSVNTQLQNYSTDTQTTAVKSNDV